MKFIKRSSNIKFNNKLISEVSREFKISEDLVKIIISKGLTKKKEIKEFLEPSNFKYHDPFTLVGVKEAVEIIKRNVKDNKQITIIGDYDTDGICSTAILYKYFESINVVADYFLPNRFVDGYGLSIETIDKIIELYNPNLIITVDCGISNFKEVEYAKSKGIEIIVTDHHEIPEVLPNCVIIDPKLENQNYAFTELCGAGVALKLVQALAGYKFASKLTSIASLATVADIVPLVNENRAIVYNGLKNYKENLPKGVIKLIDKLKITNMQASDISFKLAPKINTAGRMGDANVAFQLFIENDDKIIAKRILELTQLNEIRVSDGVEIYEDAMNMLENVNISNLSAIVLYKENWNSGVLGIVCARLVEQFNLPVCLLSKVEQEFKGSVRSIEKIDIYKELSELSHLLIRFGGHNQAGGLSIYEENLLEFNNQLNENIKNRYSETEFEQVKYYDLDLNKVELNADFLEELRKLEPFGFGNEKPIFKLTFNNAKIARMKNYNNHLKIKINNLDIVAFNYGKYFDHFQTNSNKELLIELNGENTYKGVTNVNAIVKAVKVNKLNTNVKYDYVVANILKQLKYINEKVKTNPIILNNNNYDNVINSTLKSSNFGTLVVTNNFTNYTNFINTYSNYLLNYEMYSLNSKTGENSILYLPNNDINISAYSNVIFLEPLLCECYLNIVKNAKIYVNNDKLNLSIFKNVNTSRENFAIYHNAIKNMFLKSTFGECEYNYFLKLVKLNPQHKNLKFEQFVFVTMVLSELNIITIDNENVYNIFINKDVKNALNNSKIYNFVSFMNKVG